MTDALAAYVRLGALVNEVSKDLHRLTELFIEQGHTEQAQQVVDLHYRHVERLEAELGVLRVKRQWLGVAPAEH